MWRAFRRFRRSRPFWAGLFSMLGGIEILLLPLSPLADLVLLGVAGFSGAIIGVLLIVTGLFMWFSPPNRTLAGVLALVFSLAAFVVSNLGGLVVGMVLGLIGGALALAWTPHRGAGRGRLGRRQPPPPPSDEAEAEAEQRPTGPGRPAPPPSDSEQTRPIRGLGNSGLAIVLVAGLVGLMLMSSPAHASAQPPPDPPAPPDPLLGLPLTPPAPIRPERPPPGAVLPPVLPELARILPPTLVAPLQPRARPAAGALVSGLVGDLRMDTLTVTNFQYQGIVTFPVAGGGTQRALQISLDSTDIGNLRITNPGPKSTVRVVQGRGAAHVTTTKFLLHCTRLRLNIFGVLPVEFSLDFPPPPLVVIPVLYATDVQIDYVRLATPTLRIPDSITTLHGPGGARPNPGRDRGSPGRAPNPEQVLTLTRLAGLLRLPALLRPYGLSQRQAADVAGSEAQRAPAHPPSVPGPLSSLLLPDRLVAAPAAPDQEHPR